MEESNQQTKMTTTTTTTTTETTKRSFIRQQPFDFLSTLKTSEEKRRIEEPNVLTLHIYTDENFCLKITTFPSIFMTFEEKSADSFDDIDSLVFDRFIEPQKSREDYCGFVLPCSHFFKTSRLPKYFSHSLCR